MLARHCYACHSSRAATVFGELRLDSEAAVLQGGRSGPAVVPGDPQGSRLIQAVGYGSKQPAMPPAGKLAKREIEALTEWSGWGRPGPGAADRRSRRPRPEHWAGGNLPSRASLPRPIRLGRGGTSTASYGRKLERRGIEPVGPADAYTLLRRLTLDLTGLPPTPAEIREFVESGGRRPGGRGGPLARFARVWRALGPALAGPGGLRRHPGPGPAHPLASCLALPRLRDRRLQQ